MSPPDRKPPAADAYDGEDPEQEDESTQAHTVAEEAAERGAGPGLSDSEKVKSGDETDDVQDLVDHMNQMDSSGIIDMSAYRGERNDDEEEGRYGSAAEEE